ncbi:MAG: DUF1838 family protein [Gammaproteobacteria bacterium]
MDRRDLLIGIGGAAGAAAGWPAFAGRALDLGDRADFLTACIKMRGSLDDRLSVGWVIGTRYAVVEHRAIPMMGLMAATLTRYRRIRDDAYEASALEIAYFTDLAERRLLETWQNPVTGSTVDVPMTRMGPSKFVVTADGLTLQMAAGEARGLELHHRFDPAVVRGDDVWITEVIGAGSSPAPGARPFVYNEMTTYHATMSDLADPAQPMVPTDVSFHGLVTFRPWMGFGDTPGHTTAHGAGARSARMEDLPAYWLELTELYHADVLDDPLRALGGGK